MIDYGVGVQLTSGIACETFNWRNNPKIFNTCRQFTLLDPNEHSKWMEKRSDDKSIKMFGIRNKDQNIGVCGFTSISWQSRHAEISLYIAPEFHGMRYSAKVLYTLCRHGFEDFNFNKLWGECFNNNLKSILTFKRCGFVASPGHIQHYFRHGKYIDTTFVTMLAEDWFKNHDKIVLDPKYEDESL